MVTRMESTTAAADSVGAGLELPLRKVEKDVCVGELLFYDARLGDASPRSYDSTNA